MSPKRDQSGKGATRTKPDSRLQLHDAMGFTIFKNKCIYIYYGIRLLYVISISKEPVPEEPFDAEKELADAMTRIASASQSKSTLNLYYCIYIYILS